MQEFNNLLLKCNGVEVHAVGYKNGRKICALINITDTSRNINKWFDRFDEPARRFYNSIVAESEMIPLF